MSTHEQITNNPTSAVRNTGGRKGPQGLEEPMSDEVGKIRSQYIDISIVSQTESPHAKRTEDNQGNVSKGEYHPVRLADIQRAKIVKGVTGNLNQEDIDRTPMKTISPSLGHMRKETLSHLGSGISVSRGLGCLATSRHTMEVEIANGSLKLPKESIDSYEDLRTAFRENYLQQTKHIKDPVEIHHIKQRDGESTEDFMERYKAKVLDVEGAPECMRIFGFMHGITHTGLIKCLYERIPRSMDEIYRMTTSFLQGEVAAFSHGQRKAYSSWKQSKVAKPRITQKLLYRETAIIFSPLGEEDGTECPMIIEAEMGGHFVHRVYVDGGASSEVLYEHCFKKLRKEIRDQMVPATTHLIGFSGETIWPLGQIALLVKIGDEVHSHLPLYEFHGYQVTIPTQCNNRQAGHTENPRRTINSARDHPVSRSKPSTGRENKIAIHPEYPEQTIAIGSTLTEKGRKELCSLLKQNLDIFAWKPADMTGVPRSIAEHCLNIQESPVRQKKRG
ncbi:reverse transcriptase domain-containing protein [Tanacetum coccineum]